MFARRVSQFCLLAAILLSSVASIGAAPAAPATWGCGTSYTIQWGDTLAKIAARCGTTVAALQLANPAIGNGNWIYAGQTLLLPGAVINNGNGYSTYVVAAGDTLKAIAARYGTTMAVLASLNGIYNYNLIYQGQRLQVPNGGSTYTPPTGGPVAGTPGTYVVQWGDTLRKIANRLNVSVSDLLALNPQIQNANFVYVREVIYIPTGSSLYTVQPGDTLKIIAVRYGTTVANLQALNPQIWNPNWIYVGEVIRLQ